MKPLLAAKSVAFTILVPGIVAMYVPHKLLAPQGIWQIVETRGLSMLAWLLLFGGASISLRCVWDFIVRGDGTPAPIDPPRQLVIAGLYKYTRNPMYVGVLTVIVAEAILSSSLALLAYAGLLFLCFHAFVVFYEEPALQRRFGEDYAAYCGRVPRWVGRHISPNTRT